MAVQKYNTILHYIQFCLVQWFCLKVDLLLIKRVLKVVV